MNLRSCIAFLSFLSSSLFLMLATPGSALELEPVHECIEANAPKRSLVQTLGLTSFDRNGGERKLEAKQYWKRGEQDHARILVKIIAPPDVRGSAYLIIENEEQQDVFTYLPEFRTVRRLQAQTMSGALFGTDISYEDFIWMESLGDRGLTERGPDQQIERRAVFVLNTNIPESEESEYERIAYFIDQTTCAPIRVEFYEPGGSLRKLVEIDPESIKKVGEGWLPHSLLVTDLLNDTRTELVVEEVEVDSEVPDNLFTVARLERGR